MMLNSKNRLETAPEGDARLAFGRKNYILIAIGFGIIVLGFLLMMGGKSEDPNVFSETIYDFRHITLAPIVVMLGFFFEIYAIMYRPKNRG